MGMLTDLLFPNGDPFSLERAIYGAPAAAPSAAPGAPPAGRGAASPSPLPAGMLAGLFGGSASFPTSMPPGAFPAPASPIPLPMPRPSPTAGDAFASALPPPSAASPPQAAPQAPASPLSAMASAATSGGQGEAPPVPQTSLLGRIGSLFGDRAGSVLGGVGDALDSRRNTLMALGAGLAGAPTLGTGISRGLTGAIPASQLDRQQGFQNATLHFLTSRLGMPPDQAQMVVSNPALMAQLAPQIFGAKQMQFTQVGEDMFGNKKFGFVDPVHGQVFDQSGQPVGTGGGNSAGDMGAQSYLAPGVKALDSSKVGEDYLKQFSPETQAAVNDYIGGKSMPTGNPRAGFTQAIKQIAQKYGNDIGTPADDTTFSARRTMRTQLSSAAPNSLGGQLNTGNTAIGHLADASQKALDLDNSNGWGFAPLAHAINTVRGLGTAQSAKMEALNDSIQHYGQEITKFYAGSPGGEAERQRFLTTAGAAKSPQELAAVFETEAQLMQSRLGSIDSQIKGTLGPAAAQYPVVRPESQTALAQLDRNVARLRGQTPAPVQPPQTAQTGPITKDTYDALPKGATYTAPDGSVRTKK